MFYTYCMAVEGEALARELFSVALEAVDPYRAVERYLPQLRTMASRYPRHILIGFGKATVPMIRAFIDDPVFADDEGVALTKYGYADAMRRLGRVEVLEAGHPIPDEKGVEATRRIMAIAGKGDKDTLLICAISGGGSALLVAPQEGLSLPDKQAITSLLLRAGADINELNTVRKHLSAIKGGRLAELAYPSRVVSLILSDVVGDRLDVIASGPTAPDDATFADALAVLQKYGLTTEAPPAVVRVLEDGAAGRLPETPKRQSPVLAGVENLVIGSNRIALEAVKEKAGQRGLKAEITTWELVGEAKEMGRLLAQRAVTARKSLSGTKDRLCLISGGETTVTVKGGGKGGRNTELALAFALELEGATGITLLSAGTDGTDGPTDAAGALADGTTIERAKTAGIDPLAYLENNDSYTFFEQTGDLVITGPTGTNVMDVQIILIEPPPTG